MYNPNIPTDRITDFNISFYSGLIAGIVSGILTGIIVGIIIWRLQKKNEEKELEQKAIREAEILFQQLKFNSESSSSVIFSDNSGEVLPLNLKRSLDLLKNKPIKLIQSNIKSTYLKELEACQNLINNYNIFINHSTLLDSAIERRLLKDHDMHNYQDFLAPFYGVVSKVPNEIITSRFDDWPKITNTNIEQLKMISEEESISPLVKKHVKYRNNLISSYNELVTLLN